jgi:phosphohistidine phosphatase SixA
MLIHIFGHARAAFRQQKDSKVAKGQQQEEDPYFTKEGEADTENVVLLTRKYFSFNPTIIFSSPHIRAKEMAEITKQVTGLNSEVAIREVLYGEKEPKEVYDLLSKVKKKDDSVVPVSHLSLVKKLLFDLIGSESKNIEVYNGSIACIERKSLPKTG